MASEAGVRTCARCGCEVRVNRGVYEVLDRMHFVCFHYEYQHGSFDVDEECDSGRCPAAVLGAGLPGPAAPGYDFYWKRFPGGPFALLIRIATTYLHPESDNLESLQRRARRAGELDWEMDAFKAELREAVRAPGRVPRRVLSDHVQYDDGSAEAFLRRLWRDLYGYEPPGGAPGSFAASEGSPAAGGGAASLGSPAVPGAGD